MNENWVTQEEGWDIHVPICQPSSPSDLTPTEPPHWKKCLEIAVLTTPKHPIIPLEAKNAIEEGETKGPNPLGFLHLPWTVVLRVIEVHCQQNLQCCPGQTVQMDQGIPDEVDNIEKKHTWKINLPVFKDENAKDAVTYQSWRWDLTVYWCAGCRDHTLLPYAIRSLQGYPGELVQSFGTDITLDDVLTIPDEHYNNVKVLDALNQWHFLFLVWESSNMIFQLSVSLPEFYFGSMFNVLTVWSYRFYVVSTSSSCVVTIETFFFVLTFSRY